MSDCPPIVDQSMPDAVAKQVLFDRRLRHLAVLAPMIRTVSDTAVEFPPHAWGQASKPALLRANLALALMTASSSLTRM